MNSDSDSVGVRNVNLDLDEIGTNQPESYFRQFFPDQAIELIRYETNCYAQETITDHLMVTKHHPTYISTHQKSKI